jgi:hypothetical protein
MDCVRQRCSEQENLWHTPQARAALAAERRQGERAAQIHWSEE